MGQITNVNRTSDPDPNYFLIWHFYPRSQESLTLTNKGPKPRKMAQIHHQYFDLRYISSLLAKGSQFAHLRERRRAGPMRSCAPEWSFQSPYKWLLGRVKRTIMAPASVLAPQQQNTTWSSPWLRLYYKKSYFNTRGSIRLIHLYWFTRLLAVSNASFWLVKWSHLSVTKWQV